MSAHVAIGYVDRDTGKVHEERVHGEAWLRLGYGSLVGRVGVGLFLKRRWFSRLYGMWADTRASARRIGPFVADLGIDPEESEHPPADYPSLNAFFTRRLRPGARPLDADPAALLAACDARTLVYPRLDDETLVPVKGARVAIPRLLGDAAAADPFRRGSAVVHRLAPPDYHRFHFPAAGVPGPARRVRGVYHSVNPWALAGGIPVFEVNERQVTIHETEGFGRVAIIEVGALCVGRVSQTFRPGERATRGAEKGYFGFGASTVVLLLEPGRVHYDEDLVGNGARGLETFVRMGTRIGRRV